MGAYAPEEGPHPANPGRPKEGIEEGRSLRTQAPHSRASCARHLQAYVENLEDLAGHSAKRVLRNLMPVEHLRTDNRSQALHDTALEKVSSPNAYLYPSDAK